MADEATVVDGLPVFLPGNDRDWREVKGSAHIDPEGKIVITLFNKEDAEALAEMSRNGILWQVGFDYRWPIEKIMEVNNQYKENPDEPSSEQLLQ